MPKYDLISVLSSNVPLLWKPYFNLRRQNVLNFSELQRAQSSFCLSCYWLETGNFNPIQNIMRILRNQAKSEKTETL